MDERVPDSVDARVANGSLTLKARSSASPESDAASGDALAVRRSAQPVG